MIERALCSWLQKNAEWFPVVSVTGPRQSGKSTLVKEAFPSYQYVNLEDTNVREQALEDPTGFIRSRPQKLIIDEAQLAPELFSMIQVVSDEVGTPGQYVLSGSQNFLLLKQISQSLAGRVGLLRLLPLSFKEVFSSHSTHSKMTVDDFMLQGGYPRLYDVHIPASTYYENYIETYLTRDVLGYVNPQNLATFRSFLTACAANSGKLLNITSLANTVHISVKTARSWLSLLNSSYIVFFLDPFHANIRKRLTKTPKLYFYDTGLLSYLLGIKTHEDNINSEHRGAIFETLIISETVKSYLNQGEAPELYFYRDDSKIEIDLVDMTDRQHPRFVEIKSSATYRPAFVRGLGRVGEQLDIPVENQSVVMMTEETSQVLGRTIWAAKDWLMQ